VRTDVVLGPEDVGYRVAVLLIAGSRNDRPVFSEALGYLAAADATGLTVLTDRGPVQIPLAHVYQAKRVPERRRPKRSDIVAVEHAGSLAWPPAETGHLGEWLLRAAGGWTGRANSALALGDPGRSLPEAVEQVRRWYAARGLPPRITVPLPVSARVHDFLDECGVPGSSTVLVQTAPLTAVLARAQPVNRQPAELAAVPAPDWLAMVAEFKGKLPPAAMRVLTGPALVRFASVRASDGSLLAIARGAVTGHRLHLGLVEVAPHARRLGLAQHLLRKLASWAAGLPLPDAAYTAYLQVEEANEPAVTLYAKLGFTTHHTYVTRSLSVADRRADAGVTPFDAD
jgi:GNAT superfamily N-acetyltransferase